MKYKEFREKMEQMNLLAYDRNLTVAVIDNVSGSTLVEISKNKRFWMRTDFNRRFKNTAKLENVLINATQLACTPLEEREGPKKYRVELKTTDSTLILWKATDGSDDTDFININRVSTGQKFFTKQEIKDIDPRYLSFAKELD